MQPWEPAVQSETAKRQVNVRFKCRKLLLEFIEPLHVAKALLPVRSSL